jgi:hypothetical protein
VTVPGKLTRFVLSGTFAVSQAVMSAVSPSSAEGAIFRATAAPTEPRAESVISDRATPPVVLVPAHGGTPTVLLRRRSDSLGFEATERTVPVAVRAPTRQMDGLQVVTNSVRAEAVDEATRLLSRLTSRPDVRERFRAGKVQLVVVPDGVPVTELKPFRALRNRATFDGRPWREVRGVGGHYVGNGRIAVGVPEEDLFTQRAGLRTTGFSVTVHEIAHVVHRLGLTPAERATVARLYQARLSAGGPWTDRYAASNALEYFAQSTNVFFGRAVLLDGRAIDAAWLQANDPGMHALLVGVYGAPPATAALAGV